MPDADDNPHPILARCRRELAKLPLSAAEIDRLALRIATTLDRIGMIADPGSPFFDFQSKVSAVVRHFAPDGLTLSAYVRAAARQPPLFYQSPQTNIANIEQVAAHFRGHGLSLAAYLRSAVRQPPLFCESPRTIIANIEAVAGGLRTHGLTLADYLRAAIRQPQLFYQSPPTIIANVEHVAARFHDQGLTLGAYLQAAVRRPQLFCQSPRTIIANIEGVAGHFRGHGLTLAGYVQAALKQPQLFFQSPATIISHVDCIVDLERKGLVAFPAKTGAKRARPQQPMFEFLIRQPQLFCLSTSNYALREVYARAGVRRLSGASLLMISRRQIEQELAERSRAGPRPPAS